MSPNRISSLMQPFLHVLLVLFIIGFVISWLQGDEYEDDDFSVTITYDCNRVLTERNYPAEVLSECLELKDELARKNR